MGFMRLEVWKEAYADFAPQGGGFAETLPLCEGEEMQRVSDIMPARYFARYSAPGYMDCTSSVGPFYTAAEALRECFRLYGDDCSPEDRSELASLLWRVRHG